MRVGVLKTPAIYALFKFNPTIREARNVGSIKVRDGITAKVVIAALNPAAIYLNE